MAQQPKGYVEPPVPKGYVPPDPSKGDPNYKPQLPDPLAPPPPKPIDPLQPVVAVSPLGVALASLVMEQPAPNRPPLKFAAQSSDSDLVSGTRKRRPPTAEVL